MYYEQIKNYHKENRKNYTFFGANNEQNFKGVGIELELNSNFPKDKETHLENLAEILLTADCKNHYFVEKDNTVKNGLEVIIHPHTIQEMRKFLSNGMNNILNRVNSNTECDDLANGAATHIHISKNFFGETDEQQIEALSKIFVFFSHHVKKMAKLGNRKHCGKCLYPGEIFSKEDAIKRIRFELECVKKGTNVYRYQAMNINSEDTIEFRAFQSTTNINTLSAYIELVWHLVNKSLTINWNDVARWDVWMQGAPLSVQNYVKNILG